MWSMWPMRFMENSQSLEGEGLLPGYFIRPRMRPGFVIVMVRISFGENPY